MHNRKPEQTRNLFEMIFRENPSRLSFNKRNVRLSVHILVFSDLLDIVASPVEKIIPCDTITEIVDTL